MYFLGPLIYPARGAMHRVFRWLSATRAVIDERLAEQMHLAIKHFRFPRSATYPTVFVDEELKRLRMPTLLLIGDHEVLYHPQVALAQSRGRAGDERSAHYELGHHLTCSP